jgi:tetratricopeptide (TPR) repeat protein
MRALADAERSVSQEPESPARRWVLAEIHGALGDVEQASLERQIALKLPRSADFLESADTIGRIAEESLSCSRIELPRDGTLRRGMEFLQHVLGLLESKLLDPDDPERRFEAHAATHYWIGRFHLERGDWQSAIHSLRVAHSMGFLPIDVALRLGVACFGAGRIEEAGKVFRDAVRSVRAELKAGTRKADSCVPFADLLLSWAMVCAEMDSHLVLAGWLVAEVQKRWLALAEAERRRELSALCHEGLCRIRLREGRASEAIAELERALRVQETSRCYRLLAESLRATGSDGAPGGSEVRRRIRRAMERAARLRHDGAGGAFGLWTLLESHEEGSRGEAGA